jgi:hypothetical protein
MEVKIMKKLVTGLLASLLLANSLPALAGPHGHDRHFRPHHYAPPVVRHHHRHGGYGAPVAWGLAGLALGTVLYATTSPVIAAPAVVMPPPRPPGRMAYFCESYQAYYPNVQYCPEGWRAVPAY